MSTQEWAAARSCAVLVSRSTPAQRSEAPFQLRTAEAFPAAGICPTPVGTPPGTMPSLAAPQKSAGQAWLHLGPLIHAESHARSIPLVTGTGAFIMFVDRDYVFTSLWLSRSVRPSSGLFVPLVSLNFLLDYFFFFFFKPRVGPGIEWSGSHKLLEFSMVVKCSGHNPRNPATLLSACPALHVVTRPAIAWSCHLLPVSSYSAFPGPASSRLLLL